MLSFIAVFVGLILILLEFYLPGAILGIMGGILIFTGMVLFSAEHSSPLEIFLFITATIISIILVIQFAIWRIVKAKPTHSIYSTANQQGFQAASYDKNAIGKEGVVITDLKPGGYILIDDQKYAALSIEGYIHKGERIIVIDGQEQNLMVKSNKKEVIE